MLKRIAPTLGHSEREVPPRREAPDDETDAQVDHVVP